MKVGDKIYDCYMGGIGDLENIGNDGFIEAAGKDWVIIRDRETDKPLCYGGSLEQLEEHLK